MKAYKLRHIPTGLYYSPKKTTESNLSKKGKLYTTRPTKNVHVELPRTYRTSKSAALKIIEEKMGPEAVSVRHTHYRFLDTKETDWAIEEYELKLVNVS